MRVSNYTVNFQQNTNNLFQGFEFMHVYIDKLLVLTKGDCTYHVEKLELTFKSENKVGRNEI